MNHSSPTPARRPPSRIAVGGLLIGLLALTAGCVVEPGYREGYYDHDHHRYWHQGGWHDCGDHDDHCR